MLSKVFLSDVTTFERWPSLDRTLFIPKKTPVNIQTRETGYRNLSGPWPMANNIKKVVQYPSHFGWLGQILECNLPRSLSFQLAQSLI
jgi:hypothetical protein